jgi:tetratricopeptide (TPR) repeat protein
MTSYAADVERITSQIRDLSGDASATARELSPGAERETRLLYLRFQVASLRGDLAAFGGIDRDAESLLRGRSSRHDDLWLLRAYIACKLHRFGEVESLLQAHPSLAASPQARLVRSDVQLQFGHHDAAVAEIDSALAADLSWDGFARLASLRHWMGDLEGADALYVAAEDELTAKEMHSFAWVELQRGAMYFSRGRYEGALAHYRRAEAAYPGYWLTQERIAEWEGAQGSFAEAIARYRRLYAQSPRPEWECALGDLYALAGDPATAHGWKSRALEHLHASAARGEVHLLHALADLCCELPGRSAEAVRWARRDVELRSNPATQGNLAWALYRDRQMSEALLWIESALASSMVSSRLYVQAACVYAGTGRRDQSEAYMRLALETNPAPGKAALPGERLRRDRVQFQAV